MDNLRRDFIKRMLMLGLTATAATALFSWFSCGSAGNAVPPASSTAPGEGDLTSGDTDSNHGSRNITIDHANWDWYNSQPQQVFGQVRTQKIYFAHASVGSNIMSGFEVLHNANPSKYPLSQTRASASPPAQTVNGMIYEYARGNPGWSAKVSTFETYVFDGWHNPKVDISMNKFCYIDQDADLTTYLNSMVALEAKHPNTKFVYWTMPISTQNGSTAVLRAQFNTNLRNWIATQSNKLFFDLADIESISPSGARQIFTYKGMDYENLYPGYTPDGGHLNAEGSKRVAIGLYSLFGQMLNPATALP